MSASKVESLPISKPINVGIPFWLRILLETRMAILASSGAGKSYLIRVLIENIGDKVQQIILDTEGEFVSLREQFNLLLIGKEEADIPISVMHAETVAHRLLKMGISAIIDLSEVDADERVLFVKKFGDGLLNSPKEYRHAVLLYVNEAQVFAPQDWSAVSTKTIINLATRGRKRGICLIVDSQRSSILNKNVLAQCLNKVIGRTSLPDDMKRSAAELGFASKADLMSLRKLKPGEFYCYGPAFSEDIVKFKTVKAKTTHPNSGMAAHTNPPTPAAIKKILGELADIPQEAEKDLQTKKQFQDEIRRLENQLKQLQLANGHGNKKSTITSEKQSSDLIAKKVTDLEQKNNEFQQIIKIRDLQIKALQKENNAIQIGLKKIYENIQQVLTLPGTSTKEIPEILPVVSKTEKKSHGNGQIMERIERKINVSESSSDMGMSIKLGKGHRSLLSAVAMYYPREISRKRAGFIAGISPKGGYFNNIIGECKRNNLLVTRGDSLGITPHGLEALGEYTPLPTTGAELVIFWRNRLGKGAAAMLTSLHAHYPDFISRKILAVEVTMSPDAGYFNNCLGELRTLGLIEQEGKTVRLSMQLFE